MKKHNVAIMRYKTDKRSSRLCLLSIVFDVIYFLCLYSNQYLSPDFSMGLDVLCNILFLLFAFLASEKVKNYDQQWAIYTGLGGVVQVVRIFWLPFHYLNLGQLDTIGLIIQIVSLALSAVCLFLAAVSSYTNSRALAAYLKSEEERIHG